jgi:hypothetical protein
MRFFKVILLRSEKLFHHSSTWLVLSPQIITMERYICTTKVFIIIGSKLVSISFIY